MSDKKVVIYSSASGGTVVQKKTTEMISTCQVLRGGKEVAVVWCDAEPKETREMVWSKSGKKGVYPLLFVDGEFLADFEEMRDLNEEGELKAKIL